MNPMMTVAINAAQRAGKIQKENLGRSFEIGFKGEIDLVTDVDRISEDVIIEIIKDAFPDHQILAPCRVRSLKIGFFYRRERL